MNFGIYVKNLEVDIICLRIVFLKMMNFSIKEYHFIER